MRTDNPDAMNRDLAEQSRLAREQHREPDGWEADARAEFAEQEGALCSVPGPNGEMDVLTRDEVMAFSAGCKIGARQERRRIVAGLDALDKDTAPLFVEGTAAARAVAAYTARVRAIVEGRT